VRAYAATDLGRATIRRELVEGAQVEAGQQALLLCEARPPGGIEAVVEVVAELLRELGLHVTRLEVDGLIPVRPGTAPGAWSYVEKYQLPPIVYAAILAADVTFDYTLNSRGAQKYNEDFYTLTTYHGKRVYAHRAVEAPEVLGSTPDAPIAGAEALTFPSEVLRAIADRVNATLLAAAAARAELRLTNPWGTDLQFEILPGDVRIPSGGIRRYPVANRFAFAGDENNRLYVALTGCIVTQRCEGVWVTKHCSLLGGALSAPLAVEFAGGFIVGARGGPEAARLLEIIADEPAGVHAILMGLNPKASPFRDRQYLLDNTGAGPGVCHVALGGPGLFYRRGAWGPVGNKHFQLGNIPKISLWAGAECLVADGRLLALEAAAVREAARAYGDPDALLRQFDWPADGEL
jgi:hypothetical protein